MKRSLLADLFYQNAEATPAKKAIWCDGKSASYKEMADLICHLVAPGHGYLTGVDIIHDGGKTALAFAKQMM